MAVQDHAAIDSYRCDQLVERWARERLVHDVLVAREIAHGVIRDGLRAQSVKPKWVGARESLRGEPLVGYAAHFAARPVLLHARVLEHLQAVEVGAVEPDRQTLQNAFVTRADFRAWLQQTGRELPRFWFGGSTGRAEA